MAAILERLAQDVEKSHPGFAASLREQAQQARELSVRPNFSIVETEKTETRRFSPEQRDALKKEGYVIYELTGKSIKDLREAGNSFATTWHKEYPEFEALQSRKSEVAIGRSREYDILGERKTFSEQKSLVKSFFDEYISTKVPGVKVIIGDAPDYIELAFLSPIKHRLFGTDDDSRRIYHTRTQTKFGLNIVSVGWFDPDYGGLCVGHGSADSRNGDMFVVPLIVPKGNK